MNKQIKIILALFAVLTIIVISLAGFFYFNLQSACNINRQKCNPQVFVIPQGASLTEVLDKLEKEKVIKNANIAKIYLKIIGFKGNIQAGDFKLNPKDDLSRVISVLQKGTLDFWVTIPEGYRAEQVLEKIQEGEGKTHNRNVDIYKQNEGYLFPDTYLIPKNARDEDIVQIMRNNFDIKIERWTVRPVSTTRIKINNGEEITLQDLVILASLVEREAKNDDERPIIANIIYKRWLADWPLQIDATVQYAIGKPGEWWKKELSLDDLKVNSPYSTYLNKGLPPGPICNPGIKVIDAVINQTQTKYWFYSTGKDGVTRYSVTLDGHNTNVDKFINKGP